MPTINLLYKRSIPINDKISVAIPTVGDVLDHEDEYYEAVCALTSTPFDMMLPLDDAGLDFSTMTDFDLFLVLFGGLRKADLSLVFGDLDLSAFVLAENEENHTLALVDRERGIVIDRAVHSKIASVLRRIHHQERNKKKPGNEEAKQYLLERARIKRKRRAGRQTESSLEGLIISMVNTEQFKYNYDQALDLTIYQFNESVYQIARKVEYLNRMHGVYSGTVSIKDLSRDDLTWIGNSKQEDKNA